jgi:hypothetical protein
MTEPQLTVTRELMNAYGNVELIKEVSRLKEVPHDPLLDEIAASIERAMRLIQAMRCETVAQLDRL